MQKRQRRRKFLKERAIEFEKLGKSRTFIIYNEDGIAILGYFTLGIQVLIIPENLSNRKIKDLDGFSTKIKGEKITHLPVILIGQLAKNDTYKKEVNGYNLMQYCFNKILDGQSFLGGRIILLETKNIPYLVSFYEEFGFRKLENDSYDGSLVQFIRVLNEEELM